MQFGLSPSPKAGLLPEWICSERFLSTGFHSSRAIPAQWLPPSSLGFAAGGAAGAGDALFWGTAGVPGGEELTGHLDGLGAPSPYRKATLFQFFHFGSGVGFTSR